jgi:hypothetical protein
MLYRHVSIGACVDVAGIRARRVWDGSTQVSGAATRGEPTAAAQCLLRVRRPPMASLRDRMPAPPQNDPRQRRNTLTIAVTPPSRCARRRGASR